MTDVIHPDASVRPALARAIVADVAHLGIFGIHASAEVPEIAQLMAERRIHAVVVADTAPNPRGSESFVWGLVTDLELVRAVAAGRTDLTAGDLALTEAVTIEIEAPLDEACRVMAERDAPHLLVTRDGEPYGILSGLDVARALV